MSEILLTTFNAKYIHAAFGLRYLMANLGVLQARTSILEFDIQQRAADIVEVILSQRPKIVGIGVYIWNAALSLEVAILVKKICPDILVVLGGPEVSYECEDQPIVACADYIVTGEADLSFRALCAELLAGHKPLTKIIRSPLPDLNEVRPPYALYDDRDIAHRVIYVEASRGCPFTCEFCLSSLDIPVRQFPLPDFLAQMECLLARGVRQFKFVDRTFNLNLNTSRAILEFFLDHLKPGLFLHFEMIPDRLPEGLRSLITRFPKGALQFEVGIQTFNSEVAARIQRRQDYVKLTDNLTFLRKQTGVHVHADLIVGLPGETITSFGHGFDQLVDLGPQEIQVGILKRLRGTPITRHDTEWNMVYSPIPPYEILCCHSLSFPELQQMKRFARYWDLIANSGNFVESAPLIWSGEKSAFWAFMEWTEWLNARVGRRHGIALTQLSELLFDFLTQNRHRECSEVAGALWRDYQRGGRSDRPVFLRPYIDGESFVRKEGPQLLPKRQARQQRAES